MKGTVSARGDLQDPMRTVTALGDIRKSYTGLSRKQRDELHREEAAEEQIAKIRDKPRRRTRAQKLRERINKNNVTAVPENQKPVPTYIARILTDKPLMVKNFREMRKDAAESFHYTQSNNFARSFNKDVGVPRAIFTTLLTKVVQDVDAQAQFKATQRQRRKRLMSKDTSDLADTCNSGSSGPALRPSTAGQVRGSLRSAGDGCEEGKSPSPAAAAGSGGGGGGMHVGQGGLYGKEEEEGADAIAKHSGHDDGNHSTIDPIALGPGARSAAGTNKFEMLRSRSKKSVGGGNGSGNGSGSGSGSGSGKRDSNNIRRAQTSTKEQHRSRRGKVDRSPSPSALGVEVGANTVSNNTHNPHGRAAAAAASNNNTSKSRKPKRSTSTSWGRPADISPQRLRKEKILKEREQGILSKLAETELRNRREATLKAEQALQYPWLFIVAHLSRVHLWRDRYLNDIKPARTKQREERAANRAKYAVLNIERWWSYKRVLVKIWANPRDAAVMRAALRFFWAKLQREKRRSGAKQIVEFLRDCAGSDKVKKMYFYRTKVLKIQRCFREWFELKEQRLQTMWKAMEQIGAKRVETAQKDARIAERRALKATSAAAGFSSVLSHIDLYSMKIDGYLSLKEKEVKARQEQEDMRVAMREDANRRAAARKAAKIAREAAAAERMANASPVQSDSLDKDVASNALVALGDGVAMMMGRGGHGKMTPAQVAATNKQKTIPKLRRSNALRNVAGRWYDRMAVNPATKERFAALRAVLEKERSRHVLNLTESRKRHLARGARGNVPNINMDLLKNFLLAPSHEVKEGYDMFEDDSEERKLSSHFGSGHPPFLFYSQGGLDFLRQVPLEFYRGLVPGFNHTEA